MLRTCEWAVKLPQYSILLPPPGMLLPGHPAGVKRYEWRFWTAAGFCDLGQQAEIYTKTILVPRQTCKKFQNFRKWLILEYGISAKTRINLKRDYPQQIYLFCEIKQNIFFMWVNIWRRKNFCTDKSFPKLIKSAEIKWKLAFVLFWFSLQESRISKNIMKTAEINNFVLCLVLFVLKNFRTL